LQSLREAGLFGVAVAGVALERTLEKAAALTADGVLVGAVIPLTVALCVVLPPLVVATLVHTELVHLSERRPWC
jgi:hypothetical protein